jgi:hypothetical protein
VLEERGLAGAAGTDEDDVADVLGAVRGWGCGKV